MDILGIGFPEIVFILLIAMMVFGPRRLPEIAGKAGKIVRDLRNMSNGLLAEWQREITVAARLEELEKVKQEFDLAKAEITAVKTSVTDITKTIAPPKIADLEAAAMGGSKKSDTKDSYPTQPVVESEQPQQNNSLQPVLKDSDTPVVQNAPSVEKQTPQTTEPSTTAPNGVSIPSPKNSTPVPPVEPEKLVND